MKSMRGVLWIFISVLSLILAAAFLYSCSSSGGGSGADNSGTVAVYASGGSLNSLVTSTSTGTTDTSLNTGLTSTETGTNLDTGGTPTTGEDGTGGHSLLSRMTATITRIELVNKGTGTSCTVLDESESLGIGDISNLMNFITEANCPAASYNRVRIEFEKDFLVEDKDGNESSCSLTSDRGMGSQPNVLHCSGSFCTLEINGAVNVLMKQRNNLTLNFSLKEFNVQGFGTTGACTVTLKTSPICNSQADTALGLPEGITGLVSHLSPSTQTFDLTKGHKTYTVLYSGITSSQQPGIDYVLKRVQDDMLRLNVLTSNIQPSGGVIVASSLFFNIEGVISNLDAEKGTCTMTYMQGKTIDIVYQGLAIDSALKDGASVQLKITGYDGDRFIASDLGAGSTGTTTGS